jgi:hypothetical protein
MGKICLLLNDKQKQAAFRACSVIVGNDLGRCFEDVETCQLEIDNDLDMITLEDFWNSGFLRANALKGAHHLLFKVVPVRKSPWKGFHSLMQFQVQYWSDLVRGKFATTFFRIMKNEAHKLTHFFSSWTGSTSRAFLGSLAESLFPEFVKKVSIKVWKMMMTLSQSQGLVSVKRVGEAWEDEALYKPMEVVQLENKNLTNVVGGRFCYYKPSSSSQAIYPAIVMPESEDDPVDLLQITIGASHVVSHEEFTELFRRFGDERRFRFLMIRVSTTKEEVPELTAKSMTWSFRCGNEFFDILRARVDWFECVWDFETCLTEYLNTLNPAARPAVN